MKKSLLLTATLAAVLISVPLSAANAVNFKARLSGANEFPAPVESSATGTAIIHINRRLTELKLKLDVRDAENLLSAAGAHFHCAAAGANGPIIAFIAGPFQPGLSGDFQFRVTLSDDNVVATDCGSTIADVALAMAEGNVYLNIHSMSFPGGEIRGQVE